MFTIEELKKLQNFNINDVKPLTVRGQYSKNTTTNINQTLQSVSLLTNELNNLNSYVKQSSLNTGVNFSMQQWVDEAKNSLLSQLTPSIQTSINNAKPITKIISSTNVVITTGIQSTLNQQDILLNKLESQIYSLLDKQNNVKVEKDQNGNITLIPILTESSINLLANITKILTTTINNLNKINIRISNKKSLKTIDDFVNNLSLEHVIEFTEKIIAILTLILQVKVTIRKSRDAAAAVSSTLLGNIPSAADYTERTLQYTATEQKQIEDLASAKSIINVMKIQIPFYQSLTQSIIDRITELINTINETQINTIDPNLQTQTITSQLNKIIENQLKIELSQNPPRIIQTNQPNYAAKIVE